jgi:hypothetical protein
MSTPEADPADVAEQQASASRDEPLTSTPEVPPDAPEADVVEQATVVEQDEDDYR